MLSSIQFVSMRLSETNKSTGNERNDLNDALPLTDVRGMAKRVQTRQTPATPPFQHNRHSFNNVGNGNVINGGNVRTSMPVARLPESRSCDEILSADTDDEHVRNPIYINKVILMKKSSKKIDYEKKK